MDSGSLKMQIGNNIAACRKRNNLTQAELAERMNYSDKAVSKWERGESLPDVMTLVLLAEQLGVSVNDLIGENAAAAIREKSVTPKRRVNKLVVELLASLLVWTVALLGYVVLSSLEISRSWMGFIYAVPVNAIVLLCLRSAWKKYKLNHLLVSLIVWGTLASLYASVLVFLHFNFWKIILLGLVGQAAVSLWFFMFWHPKEENRE